MTGFEYPGINPAKLEKLVSLISSGAEKRFYWWPEWRKTKAFVLELDHFECQYCKARGRYSRAEIVHHVQHLRDRPDLALSVYDPVSGGRQLISLCKLCHEQAHPESLRRCSPKPPLTEERWD